MYTRHFAAAIVMSFGVSATAAQEALAPPEFTNTSRAAEPALIQFVQSTVDRNPLVKAASFKLVASTSYESAAARPLYNPELEFEAEDTDVELRTIGISQTLDWSGKRGARESVAAAERLAVEADYQLTRRQVATELLNGLASHQTALDRTALAKERAELTEEFAQIAKRRFDAGDLQRVDFNLANLVKAEARIKLATTTSSLADAQQAISNLVPFDSRPRWPSLSTVFVAPSPFNDSESITSAMPEVRAAQSRLQAAIATVTLRKREKRADPTIGVTGGEEGGESLVGIRISVPLPLRNRFQHEVSAALAEQTQAQQVLNNTQLRANSRLSNSLQRYQIAHAAWQEWQALGQENLRQKTDELRRLWGAGELSTTEFLVQMGQTVDIRDSALELRLALWQSWFEWQSASGQLDQWLGYNANGDTDA